VDRFHPVRKLVDALRIDGRVNERTDVARRLKMFDAQTEEKLRQYRGRYSDPLIARMKADGTKLSDLERYMLARHAVHGGNEAIAARGGPKDGGVGMSTADAQALPGRALRTPTGRGWSGPRRGRAQRRARGAPPAGGLRAGVARDGRLVGGPVRGRLRARARLRDGGGPALRDAAREPGRVAPRPQPVGRGRAGVARIREGRGSSAPDSPVSFVFSQLERTLVRAEKNRQGQALA
jgi:hypothetical protein